MHRSIWASIAIFACVALATGPAGKAQETTPSMAKNPLADTRWRLVEFQSMDDAIGTIRPRDAAVYTMRLNADGTVNMQLDCNRATGTWTSSAAASGDSGTFGFGPLAMTRARCQAPNLDEKIARDADYVRSYLLRDGRLYLGLMADAGIYAWERI